MIIFWFSIREFDEEAFLKQYCEKYNVEYDYTSQTPCLDVVEHEGGLYYFNRMGEPLNNPRLAILTSYPNVIVTPHTAFYTDEAVSNMVENSILNIIDYLN